MVKERAWFFRAPVAALIQAFEKLRTSAVTPLSWPLIVADFVPREDSARPSIIAFLASSWQRAANQEIADIGVPNVAMVPKSACTRFSENW
ncbi:MAG TPA: hypothetical protein VGH08_08885 [Chthoniobacterales bacterium]|jgi:hypothetical protein